MKIQWSGSLGLSLWVLAGFISQTAATWCLTLSWICFQLSAFITATLFFPPVFLFEFTFWKLLCNTFMNTFWVIKHFLHIQGSFQINTKLIILMIFGLLAFRLLGFNCTAIHQLPTSARKEDIHTYIYTYIILYSRCLSFTWLYVCSCVTLEQNSSLCCLVCVAMFIYQSNI